MHLNRHSPYSPWLKRRCAPCHHQVNFSVSIANQNICCPCWSLRALGPCKALRRVYTAQTAEAFTAIDCSKSIPLTGACCVQVPAHLQCCSLRLITKVPNLQGRDGAGWLHWDAGRDPVQGLQAHLRQLPRAPGEATCCRQIPFFLPFTLMLLHASYMCVFKSRTSQVNHLSCILGSLLDILSSGSLATSLPVETLLSRGNLVGPTVQRCTCRHA